MNKEKNTCEKSSNGDSNQDYQRWHRDIPYQSLHFSTAVREVSRFEIHIQVDLFYKSSHEVAQHAHVNLRKYE